MTKRVLILDKSEQDLTAEDGFMVAYCRSSDEALSVLMGGSSAFGKEDYVGSGKIRPQVFVMDSAFLETYEGCELLEIIRKYYTLRSVQIYICAGAHASVDPVIVKRYNISGVVPKPLNLASAFDDYSEAPGNASGKSGVLSAITVFIDKKAGALGLKAAQLKSTIAGSWAAVSSVKVVAVSSLAMATVVSQVPSEKINLRKTVGEKEPPSHAAAPRQELPSTPEIIVVKEEPSVPEPIHETTALPAVKKPVRKKVTKVAAKPVMKQVVTSKPVLLPKIVVMEHGDEESATP